MTFGQNEKCQSGEKTKLKKLFLREREQNTIDFHFFCEILRKVKCTLDIKSFKKLKRLQLINVLWRIALNPRLSSTTTIDPAIRRDFYFDVVFRVATLWCHFKVQYQSKVWTHLQMSFFFFISTIQIDNKDIKYMSEIYVIMQNI